MSFAALRICVCCLDHAQLLYHNILHCVSRVSKHALSSHALQLNTPNRLQLGTLNNQLSQAVMPTRLLTAIMRLHCRDGTLTAAAVQYLWNYAIANSIRMVKVRVRCDGTYTIVSRAVWDV